MSQREDALKFETGRIKALQEERLHIQKKTFTKWMNSFLVKARMEVEDLFTDLGDGRKLLKLLEIISGEKLGKPNSGRMRVHKIENVNKSLAFLHTKVRLESIGAEDIVDGNPRLILGLIWTIILRFQIQEIEIDVDEENESSEKKSAKDALLLWCQRKTNGYSNVNIQDFTGSWRSGLGFNALIHAHRPDLLEFDKLVPTKHIDNLNNAFDVAERGLGIPRLLDAEDIDTAKPDEKSVLTYVASYYHTFAQMYNKDKSGRRIANIISQIKEADDLKYKYELDGKSLLAWIRATVEELNSRDFPNNLEGVQKLLVKFKEHITVNKPPKYNEKSEIEANYFIINTRLKELNQGSYVPPEGLLVHDIERGWAGLEKAEYLRELALREEVIRQTNLEQLAIRFEKKSLLREGYLKDMIQVLSDPRYGINLAQVEATLKKHEAISADILAREQRCEQLVTMADYLVKESYHDCSRVKERADEIGRTWDELIELLNGHKINLEKFSSLMQMIRDIDTLTSTIRELENEFGAGDVGVHLIGVEDLLGKHSIVESQISSMGESIKRIGKVVGGYESGESKEVEMVKGKLEVLNSEYSRLLRACKVRRGKLEDSKAYFLFVQDHEEEEAWVNEKSLVFGQGIVCKDLRGVLNTITAHKMMLDEVKARRVEFGKVVERGAELVRVWEKEGGERGGGDGKVQEIQDVKARIKSLEGKWKVLWGLGEGRGDRLRTVLEAFQFYSDANEMDSWVTEKRPLVASSDYGSDEPSAQALLQRHLNLEEEIIAYEADVKGLNSQADKLVKEGISSIQELSELGQSAQSPAVQQNGVVAAEDEFVVEQKLVPEEYYEDEVVERTDYATVTEERAVAQVKALYLFQGQEIEVKKGEVMFLLNKTNSDWWNVRKANGEDGFVPANYVKEIEPKVVMVQVRKPEVVKDVRKVKKTRMVLKSVQKPKKRQAPTIPVTKKSSHPPPTTPPTATEEPISKRTERINADYSQILDLSSVRKSNLSESIKLFQFLRECDDFEKWVNEKKKYLSSPDEDVVKGKRAFEKFVTDLSASNKRVVEIDGMVAGFEEGSGVLERVKKRAEDVRIGYNELLVLKGLKEKSLEGALSVELFYRTCEEVSDWMGEKVMQIDTDEWRNNDLKTVQALQRKHGNLERELAPISEKVERVKDLCESVKASYPNERVNVEGRKDGVVERWEALVRRADERKAALQDAVGMQIFVQGVKGLVLWGDGVLETLDAYVASRDVSSAEEAIKCHSELGDEIRGKANEFHELVGLGDTIGGVALEKVEVLKNLEGKVNAEFGAKGDWLSQVLDLQVFLREADHIDSGTRNGLSFVKDSRVGADLDEVEMLIKRHSDFENTLVAMDERLKGFVIMGDRLVGAGHFESNLIAERKNGVVERKGEVKALAKTRKEELLRSLKYHEFSNDVYETLAWVNEKIQVAKDESYKDLSNVDKKLKKHEAFAGELRANEVRIKNINRAGEQLVVVVPEKEGEIRESVRELNELWEELVRLSGEKYEGLRQAEAQANFNKDIEGVLDRLAGIEGNVRGVGKAVSSNGDVVSDRRSCKDAVKKAAGLGVELGAVAGKVGELERVVDDMEKDGHFDSERIRGRVDEAKGKIGRMVGPVEELKRGLEERYRVYSFLHELEVEGGWIDEKRRVVEGDVVVQDLYQAQTGVKKHKKVEQEVMNRGGAVAKLVERGNEIVSELVDGKVVGAPDSVDGEGLRKRIVEFERNWEGLKAACREKAKKLELSLRSQQFFFDAGEIEGWMGEKEEGLRSLDCGKDVHSAVKLLTKHKTVELEMDSYNGLVAEMRNMANQMVSTNHPDKVLISAKISGVEEHMGVLRKLAGERRGRLINRVHMLEYLGEGEEFVKYVDEVFGREVGCNEYGNDYEHLCVLKMRFSEVELKVEGVNERFKMLEESGARLAAGGGDGVEGVEGVRVELREKWNNMLALMAAREQKLHAAGEIHAFNRDVADALARIQEKLNSIPETVGRDVNSCESMLRAHEGFENDLLALEAQLQVLVDDASRLQSLYPTNAANIREEQAIVIESWNNLQNKATLRKEQLQNAVDFWRFSAEYANLTSFISSLLTTLPSQPKVRDTASSQALMNEHERIRSEIDAREGQFKRVIGMGAAMVEEGHPDREEVSRMIEVLEGLKGKVLVSWENKKVYLDQLIDLNIFLRDAKGLETVCSGQEVSVGSIEFGESVEDCDRAVKRFEAFEKLVVGGEEKFKVLETQGGKLVRQDHFESAVVEERLREVGAARGSVLIVLERKKKALDERLRYVQFLRDVGETTVWVDEKVKRLQFEGEGAHISGLNLQEKIKKLKKFQGYSGEVSKNRGRVEGLVRMGKEVYGEPSCRDVEVLENRWGELVKLVEEFGKDLEEAHDILEFTVAVEEMEGWVREKESLVHAGDTGRDYEHCCEIIKRLEDVDSGIRVDDSRVRGLNNLADKLVRVTGDPDGVIEGKRVSLNGRWGELKGGLEGYRVKLERALAVHQYNRDSEEVEERIAEKLGGLGGGGGETVELLGRDLEHCEGLVRKHDMVEGQVFAIEQKVRELEAERERLVSMGVSPDSLKSVGDKWLEVSHACLERRSLLGSSLEYHRFLKKFNEVKGYFESVSRKVNDTKLGGNVEEAEAAEKGLAGLWAEVVARDGLFSEVVKVGRRAVVEEHAFAGEFKERVAEVEGLRGGVQAAFKLMEVKVGQSVRMQRLLFKVREVEAEIEFNEGTLVNSRGVGESLSGVGVLLRRHSEFTKEFGGIEGEVSQLIAQGEALIPGHYDGPAIARRLSELKSKLDRLKSRAQTRASKLHESYELHKFVLEIHEIENYAIERLKIARDDNYSDMSNLQSKIQRHSAFESEVSANYERVRGVVSRAAGLREDEEGKRGAGDGSDDEGSGLKAFVLEICERVDGLEGVWKELVAASGLKRERLGESYQALLFNQNLDDIDAWMDELEGQLESEDHGVDLESVEGLINKWVHLESEFNHKSDSISGVGRSAEAFVQAEHYMAGEIVERVAGIKRRYAAMSEPLHIRRENLEETRRFFEFCRDVEEEGGWVNERVGGVGVDAELGANLTQVQSLQKKHNQLESEMISHEPLISSLSSRASAMVRSGHYASDQINAQVQQLTERFQELKDSAAVRRLRLADSLLSQSFYDEANELLSWMGEKSGYLRGIELSGGGGKECENVSGLLKRLEAFTRDLEGFSSRIGKVNGVGEGLVERGHFDSDNIRKKIEEVSYEYSELQKGVDKKSCRLMDAKRYYEFSKSCSETIDWINEMMNIAGSEEYGRDVEHVEVLIQKFEGFMGAVQESRASVVVNLAEELVEEGYPDVERVRGRAEEVRLLWEEFKELSGARLEALLGAKQVHSFDRTADETISWINEKHAVVCSEEYGHDLESIQRLIRHHAVFENDLKPVESKVGEVRGEAERLRNLFVDASEHIDAKLGAVEEAWKELVERTKGRGDRLSQAESLQAYFDKYSELMAFVNEMVAKVTSGEMGRDVRSAEGSLGKNEMILREIHAFGGVKEFCERGEGLIQRGHFMGEEIREKVVVLSGRWNYLRNVAVERNELFKKNLDLRVYLVQLDELDRWLSGKEPELREVRLGESIREVEELIREHEEFVHTLEAQEGRVEGLKRKTLIEEAWEEMRRREEVAREVEAKRLEKERVEMVKRREVERITHEINKSKKGKEEEDSGGKEQLDGGSRGRGGFLGNTRFGSFVFGGSGGSGGERRRGSEPTTPSPTKQHHRDVHDNNASSPSSPTNNNLYISITPPSSSLDNYANAAPHQQDAGPALLSRSESLRLLNTQAAEDAGTLTLKKPKRTPSFTTRRRTASFRNKKKNPENLPPVEIEAYLERKHELQAGGKRAAVRSWKHYYVLLCGQLMCFFKDKEDFELSKVGSSSPINVCGARCEVASDYTKRKFVFRVKPVDGSEYLFAAESSGMMEEWVRKVNFHAELEPKDQLMSMAGGEEDKELKSTTTTTMPPPPPLLLPPQQTKKGPVGGYDSTTTDEEDEHHRHPHAYHQRKPKPRSSTGSLHAPRSREPIYANHHEEPQTPPPPATQTRSIPTPTSAAKPPIPPRSSSIILEAGPRSPAKTGDESLVGVDNQQYFVSGGGRPLSVDRMIIHQQQRSNGFNNGTSYVQPQPPQYPPVPSTFKPAYNSPTINNRITQLYQQQQAQAHHFQQYNSRGLLVSSTSLSREYGSGGGSSGRFDGSVGPSVIRGPQQLSPRSTGSLPPGLTIQHPDHHNNSSNSENEQHALAQSPRGDTLDAGAAGGSSGSVNSSGKGGGGSKKKKEHKDRNSGNAQQEKDGSGGLMGLFRRKKATQL